jgi:hypothetical protein
VLPELKERSIVPALNPLLAEDKLANAERNMVARKPSPVQDVLIAVSL